MLRCYHAYGTVRNGTCLRRTWFNFCEYFYHNANTQAVGFIFITSKRSGMTEILLTPLAVLLRILSNSAGNVFQKQLTTKTNHPLIVNFITYLMLTVACIFIGFFIDWQALTGQFWFYSILGGMVGALGNGFLVKALQKGDLSVLGPINAYKSVIGIIFGIFLLGEIPNIWGILGIVLIIYGSYFVLDTTAERFSLALFRKNEIQFRIWAMVLTAIEAVFVKKVILASSTTIAFISWCGFGAVFSFFLLFIYQLDIKTEIGKINNSDFRKYLGLIVCMGTMQFSTNYVFDHMQVGYALSFFQLSIIVSVILGYRVFREVDIRKKLIGSMIMVAGSILIILLKDW